MKRNLKLRSKIGLGFVVALVFTAAVGLIGYWGLEVVLKAFSFGESINHLTSYIENAQKFELDYALNGTASSIQATKDQVGMLADEAEKFRTLVKDPADVQRLTEVMALAKKYEQAFSSLVQLEETKKQALGEMEQQARMVEKSSRDLRGILFEEQMATNRQADRIIASKTAKVEMAEGLLEKIHSANVNQMVYMVNLDVAQALVVDDQVQEILDLVGQGRELMKAMFEIQRLDDVEAAVKKYGKAVTAWRTLQNKKQGWVEALSQLGQEGDDQLERLRAALMDRAPEEGEAGLVSRMLGLVWKLKGRLAAMRLAQAKNMAFPDPAHLSAFEGAHDEAMGIASDLERNMVDPAGKKRAQGLKESISRLKGGFELWLQLTQSQKEEYRKQVQAFIKIQTIGQDLIREQKASMNAARQAALKKNTASQDEAEKANAIQIKITEIRLAEKKFSLDGNLDSARILDGLLKEILALARELAQSLEDLSARELAKQVASAAEAYGRAFEQYKTDGQGQNLVAQNLARHAEQMETTCLAVRDVQTRSMRQTEDWSHNLIMIGTILALLAGMGAAFFLTRLITRPLRKSVHFAGMIRQGDLSGRLDVRSGDEIGELASAFNDMASSLDQKAKAADRIAQGDFTLDVHLNSDRDVLGQALAAMVDRLSQALTQVHETAVKVEEAAGQLSGSSASLSDGATQQAASLEEISSSLAQVTQHTQDNAEHASEASRLSKRVNDAVGEGNLRMGEMMTAMDEINESSKAIAKIIKTIDDIAFQTNLLALNAAVEAARAGRHGKGFAVVAQEVRNLAGRSAKAAQETEEMIQTSLRRVDRGMGTARGTSEALREILGGVEQVSGLVEDIARSSEEQAGGLNQINQGLGQIQGVIQNSTANAEQTSAAAAELAGLAVRLNEMLGRFRLRTSDGSVDRMDRTRRLGHDRTLEDSGEGRKALPPHSLEPGEAEEEKAPQLPDHWSHS